MITVETRDKVEQYLKGQGITQFFVYIGDAEDGHLMATSRDEYQMATLLGNLINYHPQIAKSYALALVAQMGPGNARDTLEWAIDACGKLLGKEPAKIHWKESKLGGQHRAMEKDSPHWGRPAGISTLLVGPCPHPSALLAKYKNLGEKVYKTPLTLPEKHSARVSGSDYLELMSV